MASIEIFKNESFGEVRVAGTSESEALRLAADQQEEINLQKSNMTMDEFAGWRAKHGRSTD